MQGMKRPIILICSLSRNRTSCRITRRYSRFNYTTQSESTIKHHPDDWSFASKNYHQVEHVVQPVINELVKWATQILPPDLSHSSILDEACGTGTVTIEVRKLFPKVPILAVDSSAGMLEVFNRTAKKKGFENVKTRLLDGGNLIDVHSGSITHAFACTFIDLAHNASACVRELHRVITPDGILAMNTWIDPYRSSIGGPWNKFCQKVNSSYKAPMVMNPNWSTSDQIRENLVKAGFKDVHTKQMMTHWRWNNSEEMMSWFFDGGNPVAKRWHEALIDECGVNLEDVREPFHHFLMKEYLKEGVYRPKDELVNLTIARK